MQKNNKFRIKKDDTVKIVAGKDKGKIGKVLKVITKSNRLIVKDVNIVKRHTKVSAKNTQGGIIKKEAPFHLSNAMLVCNKCIKPTRVRIQRLDDGNKKRVCVKCNEIMDT